MAPKYRNKRLLTVFLCALALVLGAWLLSAALRQNTEFFHNPSEIAAPGFISDGPRLRVGGIVVSGSVRAGEGLRTVFDLRDFEGDSPAVISVSFTGALPDLFREGQGIVIVGELERSDLIAASQVLAKHDENYKPAVYDKSD
jgi:cytochrome c-type biogenesis protein CcmE